MRSRLIIVGTAILGIVGCTSAQKSSQVSRWKTLASSEEFKIEKATYIKRLGADICWGTGVASFLDNPDLEPTKECVFPSSSFLVESEDENAILMKGKKELKQNIKQLQVFQVTDGGFVVESPNRRSRVVYIHKTDESGVVDGSFLDPMHMWSLYEYTGPFTYQTRLGSKTVHSFRKVSGERLTKANEGLKVYTPRTDLYIATELWDRLDALEKEKHN